MMPRPASLQVADDREQRSTSVSVSAEVGSSMMMSRASVDSARAISTICCSATERSRTSASGIDVEADPRGHLAGLPGAAAASS